MNTLFPTFKLDFDFDFEVLLITAFLWFPRLLRRMDATIHTVTLFASSNVFFTIADASAV